VATDYAGLGTPGVHAYLNGPAAARNIVDMVRASVARPGWSLARRWAVVGHSQGGAAAVVTARYATALGSPELDYRGGVATGVPAYAESLVDLLGPLVPPFPISRGLTGYALMIVAGLRASYPADHLDRFLTPLGRQWVDRAEQLCSADLAAKARGVVLGSLF